LYRATKLLFFNFGYKIIAKAYVMLDRISNYNRFIFWIYKGLDKIQNQLIALLSGFLLGRITNEMSLSYTNWIDVLKGLFSITYRPTNFFTWLSLVLLVIIPLLNRYLEKLHRKHKYDRIFAFLVRRHIDSSLAIFNTIGWNSTISLQVCPDLHRGWKACDIQFDHNTMLFSLPKEYEQAYQEYLKKYYQEKRFFDDGVKIMLKSNPSSFSDTPTLILNTQETLFSHIQFYRDNVAILASKRNELIYEVFNDLKISFPHSLCMHAIVVTSDDRVLITKRSPKVIYFPGTWSCSIEEQLALQDFQGGSNKVVLNWFKRLLKEELGLGDETYNESNLRILSVFLESEILSISICGHVVLNLSSTELDQILKSLPRTDYEFTEWAFLTHKQLIQELFQPSRLYHPTSGYRMLMALIKRYGEPKVAVEFFNK
jgi:isopentenyldiphosphate isomerase